MLNEGFFADDTAIQSSIAFDYDYGLVFLSVLIAAAASYSGFDTLERYGAARRRITRLAWLATGAFTLGGGIWSMHFVAMLAIEMDVAVRYDAALTFLSAVFAFAACGLAMRNAGADRTSAARIIAGGAVLGAGIGLMHYTGMAAMRMGVNIRYDPLLFAASIVFAVAYSSLSLHLLRVGVATRSLAVRFGGAMAMGGSIAAMHYTGMAATYFTPGAEQFLPSDLALDNNLMVMIVGAGAFIATLMTLIASSVHRQFQQRDRKLTSQGIYLEKVIQNAVDGIVLIKPDGEIMVVNPVIERYFGYRVPELIGRNISLLMSDETAGHHDKYLCDAQTAEPKILDRVRELEARRKDGSFFPIDLAVNSIDLPDRRYFMGVVRDISDRKQAEEEKERLLRELTFKSSLLEEQAAQSITLAEELSLQKQLVEENMKRSDHLARHDALTKLPNRRYFFEQLEKTLKSPRNPGSAIVLLYIDLDNFKPINDKMGHERGDSLLIEVANNIREFVRNTDMAARLGGDEFALVAAVEDSADNREALTLANRILLSLRIAVETPGGTMVTGASIGVAVYPRDGADIDELMKSADMAMYQAKNSGRDQVRFYDSAAGANLNKQFQDRPASQTA